MLFLAPNQQYQSTEGKKKDIKNLNNSVTFLG